MENETNLNRGIAPWKRYIFTTLECLIAFYIATFCMALNFFKYGVSSPAASIMLGILYIYVIYLCVRLIVQRFSLAALMLIVPIAPLIALIMVVTLIPILQYV